MSGQRLSVAVVLSVGGRALDSGVFSDAPGVRVLRAECARGERATCVAATLEHEGSSHDLLGRLRPWAAGRGFTATAIPVSLPDRCR